MQKVRVQVLDRQATTKLGVQGLAVSLARADGITAAGQTRVTVDYKSAVAQLGGDALSRLRLVRVSDGQAVATQNDVKAHALTATVALAANSSATTFAVAAAASGDNGDYKATSLSAASTWDVSQQSGSFNWSYPIKAPAPAGGAAPSLALSYSSSSIDGRTSGNNTQGSWIGDGWDLWPGYIERTYRACVDDKDTKEKKDPNNSDQTGGDLCYFNDNATMSVNGGASELAKVASTDSGSGDKNIEYKAVTDDGSRIEMVKAGNGNGDVDGAYWRMTAQDGTQYFFGRDKGQGGSSADTKTGSVWTAPVYSNHPDEPGYDAAFSKSRVTRAWRWNLDHVVDPNGNTLTYFYTTETGAYGREHDKDKRTTYERGGALARVEYGSRTDAAATVRPGARIVFDSVDRCLGTCFNDTGKPIAKRFPDTPWDQYCDETPCTTEFSPTFWTQKRLSKIRAQVYSGSGDTYTNVNSWELKQTYLMAGGNESTPMWLKSITHTGEVTSAGGAAVTDPATVFNPNADVMPNRVNTPNGHSSLFRSRVDTITTDTGAQLGVTYSAPECNATVPKPWSNTKRCFPQFYGAEGEDPKLDWFHKYVVTRLDIYDNTGGFEHEQTNYDYLDSPAWAYDGTELVKPKERTWGQFRGYGRVRVREGLESGTQSSTEYRYFRGMDGDKQPEGSELPPTGTPRSVQVEDSFGTKIDDHPAYAGQLRESITYNGAGGDWVTGTLDTPSRQGPTAESGVLKAWKTYTSIARTRTKLSTGATRWTKTITKVNDDNQPVEIDDLGDESTASDDRCRRTEYARNTSSWILDIIKRTETVDVACTADAARPADVLADVRTYYDDADTFGATPTRGLAVRVEELDSWSGTTPKYVTTSRTGYDVLGRTVSQSDALSRTTTSVFTPALTGPVTQSKVTNPAGHVKTTTLNPALGLPVKILDANNAVAQMSYDGAGRLLAAWAPGRDKAAFPAAPSVSHTYQLRKNAASTVTTKTLTAYSSDSYRTTVTLFDGLLRQRQTQLETLSGGRAITESVYDSRGLLEWSSNPYYDIDNTPPSTSLVTAQGHPEIPALTQNTYDGAERLTAAVFIVAGDEKWRTKTVFAGEKASTTPPAGGTATTTIVDARGRKAELRQYKLASQVGSDTATTFDKTTYEYTARDELARVVGPGGNAWSYRFDLRGHKVGTDDPDNGASTATYDAAGQMITSKDARGKVLGYTYDDLGRKTSTRQGSLTGVKLTEWQYDTAANGLGKLAKSIRYEYNSAGTASAYTNAVTSYDTAGRPLGSSTIVPASDSGLCASAGTDPCTYTQNAVYRPNGEISQVKLPAVADLAKETVVSTYNALGLPDNTFGTQLYAQDVVYNQLDQMISRNLGAQGSRVQLSYVFDEPTGRLAAFNALAELKADIYNLTYTYNDAGNVTSISDKPDNGQTSETECFGYDYLNRLTEAWTPSSLACSTAANKTALGGAAPYWRSYTYDASGNRKTETTHATTDTTRTYTYPAAGGAAGTRPHAAASVTTVVGTAAAVIQKYAYDAAGNTTCRPTAVTANVCPSTGTTDTAGQLLGWNDENRLATSTDKTGATTYVYDADGNRLIRRDPTGSTLYLPNGQEVRKPKTGAATGTRYYVHAGTTIAVRTAAALTWMINDHHGTGSATVNSTTLAVTRRRSVPFGEDRGTSPTTWAGDKGFVGGTKDNTGLTHLGAREYDPKLGRFISVDPVMDLSKPDQWNGYSYSNDNPVTLSDPSGLNACTPDDGASCTPGANGRATTKKKKTTAPPSDPPRSGGGSSGGSGGGSGGGAAVTPGQQFVEDVTCSYFTCRPRPRAPGEVYSAGWSSASVHIGLQIGGLVPVLGDWLDGVDATLYEHEGEHAQAALSASSLVPAAGVAVTFGRWGFKGTKTVRAARTTRGALHAGGFAKGIGVDEIESINRSYGGSVELTGSTDTVLANAARQSGFYDKSASVIRDIAGRHLFDNGNKRTAQEVVERLMDRNNVMSGPDSATLRGIIGQVGRGELRDVDEISSALRGY